MAARKTRTTLNDTWREKIQASQIINRLQKHVNGEIEMSSTQIKAADILLKKIAPDLQKTEMVGDGGGPVRVDLIERIAARRLGQ
jgi:hypothetical protein